ncbi:MAG: hypothetical protein JNM22_07650 [Saprospiraceae bacterium]|nr:hypothetical protein [Saprospiraceae bacterium]
MNTKYHVISFGEYRGHTLPWVLFNDTNYFYRGIRANEWSKHKHPMHEVETLDYLSRHISVPNNEEGNYRVIYLVLGHERILRKVLILPRSENPPSDLFLVPIAGGIMQDVPLLAGNAYYQSPKFKVDVTSNVIDLSYAIFLSPNDNRHGSDCILQAISACYGGPIVTDWTDFSAEDFTEEFVPADDGIWSEEWCQEFFSNDKNFQMSMQIDYKRR